MSADEAGSGSGFQQNPASKWVEPSREDDLTLWEVQRRPRKVTAANRTKRVRCALKGLNDEFRCVICLGYIKQATAVMVCLHRFCSECIHKCIRVGMKECPSCRKPIPSRRSLRFDEKFDLIIKNVLGDNASKIEEEEARAEAAKSKVPAANKMVNLHRAILKKKHMVDQQRKEQELLLQTAAASAAGSPAMAAAAAAAKTNPKKRPRQEAPKPVKEPIVSIPEPAAEVAAAEPIPIRDLAPSPLLELELRRHPGETRVDRLQRSFLTIRADAHISTLKEFLSRKLEYTCSGREFEITSTLDDESVILDDEMELMHAQEAMCSENDETLVLKYKVIENSS